MTAAAGCHFSYHETTSSNFTIQSALRDPTAHVRALSQQPDFRILTTFVWVRLAKGVETPSGTLYSVECTGYIPSLDITLCDRQSDLGLLKLHHIRLAEAAEALGWRSIEATQRSTSGLEALRQKILAYLDLLPEMEGTRKQWLKLRVMISKSGDTEIDSSVMDERDVSEVIPRPFIPRSFDLVQEIHPTCHVLLDTEPTQPSLFTNYKTTYRVLYDAARSRAGITKDAPTEKEVLIFNEHGEITEASLSTVYFHRDDRWITPAAICGGVVGVTRRLAIALGLCTQGLIEVSDLVHGEAVWLSNAARGFFLGRVHLSDEQRSHIRVHPPHREDQETRHTRWMTPAF